MGGGGGGQDDNIFGNCDHKCISHFNRLQC